MIAQWSGSEKESKSWQIEGKLHITFATCTLLCGALGGGEEFQRRISDSFELGCFVFSCATEEI